MLLTGYIIRFGKVDHSTYNTHNTATVPKRVRVRYMPAREPQIPFKSSCSVEPLLCRGGGYLVRLALDLNV